VECSENGISRGRMICIIGRLVKTVGFRMAMCDQDFFDCAKGRSRLQKTLKKDNLS
jgi:hypothetical protein